MNITAIGSSHIFCLANSPWGLSKNGWRFKWLGDFSCGVGSRIVLPLDEDGTEPHLIPDLTEWLRQDDDADLFALTISGSDWLNFCVSQREEPFDFILPSRQDLPEVQGARLIPYTEIKERLRQYIRHIILGVPLIAQVAQAPVIYLEPPPPIESNAHIAATSDWEKESISARGVTSQWLRLKMYLLHSELIAEACEAAGVPFHPVPPEARSAEGFMPAEGVGHDPIHATPEWGRRILEDIDRSYP